jgi:hypothetical protein
MTALAQRFTWTSVINRLQTPDSEPKVRVPVDYIAHPLDEGMQKLDTPTDGSYIDYGIRVTELTWCVVRHYSDAYDVQLVRLQPSEVALAKREQSTQAVASHSQISIANLPREAPGLTIALGTVAGAAIGAWSGGGKAAAMGAVIGGCTALAAIAVSTAESSPATAQVAQNIVLGVSTAALGRSTARRPALPPAPKRPASSRTESRADRFDRADFGARHRKPTNKK